MKNRNRFAYARMKPGNTSPPNFGPRSKKNLSLLKLYQDCRLPLDIFLECLFDKDFSRLAISGKPTQEETASAWEAIYLEYAELINDGSHNELYDKTIEINYLATKVFIIDKIVTHFRLSYNEDLEQVLNYYGVRSGILPEDDTTEKLKKLNI